MHPPGLPVKRQYHERVKLFRGTRELSFSKYAETQSNPGIQLFPIRFLVAGGIGTRWGF